MALTLQAQLQKITLEESVLQQGRKFGADKLSGFQWLPNSNQYIYVTDFWKKIVIASAQNTNASTWTTTEEINSSLNSKLGNLFGIIAIDNQNIIKRGVIY